MHHSHYLIPRYYTQYGYSPRKKGDPNALGVNASGGERADKGSGNSVFLENVWADLTRNASNQVALLTDGSRDKVAHDGALPSPETERATQSAGRARDPFPSSPSSAVSPFPSRDPLLTALTAT
ncbi:hypothetical protein KM043_009853 [Ampulex compressa]|nr:hypothetical protein KM043_009853 [Ampulex compressa]